MIAPVRIGICHCFECQRRTGSVFGVQARFPRQDVGHDEFVGVENEERRHSWVIPPIDVEHMA